MAEQNELEKRRQEAQQAMEGEEHRARRAEREAGRDKRRREAMLAMEGETHRKKREGVEKGKEKVREEESRKQTQAATVAQISATEKAEQGLQQELAREQTRQRIKKIEGAGELIEKLKTTDIQLESVRTLKTDMGRAVKEGGVSVAQIALSEQAKRRQSGGIKTKKRWATLPLIFAGLILVVAVGGFLLWQANKQPPPEVMVPTAKPLIFTETNQGLEVTSTQNGATDPTLQNELKQAIVASDLNDKAAKNIYLYQQGHLLTFAEFRQVIGLQIPAELARYLGSEFMLGVYKGGGKSYPFLLVKARSFELVWRGLLSWEKTMANDLVPLFGKPNLGGLLPTSLPAFTDKLINNKDARVLTNDRDETVVFYAFLDNQTVAIAQSEEVFLELFRRFLAQG